ncbi:hypothetical protein BDB00DRAFT_803558 [Zychaea mexicana]|uniref:uncharacterized protein n=1 Tax=Zychaea mexicana TaxID=64656 RepID=UPI0022FDE7CF|nr:uncharacterized protein BDB00DRAFT_803558 [Zychaea mexicana]KAI9497672.1 hypothetical protein BDB00DRAFT_803558 [Zychaea mexicana]
MDSHFSTLSHTHSTTRGETNQFRFAEINGIAETGEMVLLNNTDVDVDQHPQGLHEEPSRTPTEEDSAEQARLLVLEARCAELMAEHEARKVALANELGFSLREVEKRCENNLAPLVVTTKAISSWNLFVSMRKQEEDRLRQDGVTEEETIQQRNVRYGAEYQARRDERPMFQQLATEHNLEAGFEGYIAPKAMTQKSQQLRLNYAEEAHKAINRQLSYIQKVTGIEGFVCFGYPKVLGNQARRLDTGRSIGTELGVEFWDLCQVLNEGPKYAGLQENYCDRINNVLTMSKQTIFSTYIIVQVTMGTKEFAKIVVLPRNDDVIKIKMIPSILLDAVAPEFGKITTSVPWNALRKGEDRYVELVLPLPDGVEFKEPTKELKRDQKHALAKALETGSIRLVSK